MSSAESQAEVISLSDARDARSGARPRCSAQTASGQRCRNYATEDGLCRVHAVQGAEQRVEPDPATGPDPVSGRDPAATSPEEPDPTGDGERGPRTYGGPASGDTSRVGETTEADAAVGSAAAVAVADLTQRAAVRLAAEAERRGWRPPVDAFGALGELDASALTDGLTHATAFLRRRLTGDYEVDAFGFDDDLTTNLLMPLVRPLHRYYWRVSARGEHHLPREGGALVVANHAGTLPADAIITRLDIFEHTGRHARELGADLVFRTPVIGELARKTGATLASGDDADRLLESGEMVAVWPEGYKGLGKAWKDRYKLQRFGRGGFVATALRAQVPIVPTAIVGSEEIWPLVYDLRIVARALGLPYFPVVAQMFAVPIFGPLALLPLPSKWVIEYGDPIDTTAYGPDAADDPMVVFDLADQVRDRIQDMLHRNLLGRRSIFL